VRERAKARCLPGSVVPEGIADVVLLLASAAAAKCSGSVQEDGARL
jgi:hypothetical protein